MKVLFCYYKDVEAFKNTYFPTTIRTELDRAETISEYPQVGTFYLDYWSQSDFCKTEMALKIVNESFGDVRSRCRGLRGLDNDTAKKYYIQVVNFWLEFLQTNRVSTIYTICVDTFIVYACHEAADRLNVEVKSYVRFFIEGFWRKTRFGELEEVSYNLSNLSYLEDYFERKEESHFLRTESSLRNEVLLKKAKSLYKRINYHFLGKTILRRKEWKYRFSDFKRTNYRIPSNSLDYVEGDIDDVMSVLFLHYTPEATTDFWAGEGWWNYEELILEKLHILKEIGIQVTLKEHRHMHFKRKKIFYESIELFALGNWLPFDRSFWDISENVQFVIVTTGSVGIEAIYSGKDLILLDLPYYLNYDDVDQWIKGIGFVYLTDVKRKNILQRLSKALLR